MQGIITIHVIENDNERKVLTSYPLYFFLSDTFAYSMHDWTASSVTCMGISHRLRSSEVKLHQKSVKSTLSSGFPILQSPRKACSKSFMKSASLFVQYSYTRKKLFQMYSYSHIDIRSILKICLYGLKSILQELTTYGMSSSMSIFLRFVFSPCKKGKINV